MCSDILMEENLSVGFRGEIQIFQTIIIIST